MKKYDLQINGTRYEVEIQAFGNGSATVLVNGSTYQVEVIGEQMSRVAPQPQAVAPPPVYQAPAQPAPVAQPLPAPTPAAPPGPVPPPSYSSPSVKDEVEAGPGDVLAPMPGLVLEVKVKEGEMTKTGDVVLRMEAMKMENDILASRDGKVAKVHVEEGTEVQGGQILVTIED